MPGKKVPYPAYRIMLHLYPKSYRQEYGEQMLQTLQDMLDETTGSLDRLAIWLRVIAETPLSVIKENISNIGEGSMNKLTKIPNRQLAIGVLSIAILFIGFMVGVGRNTIVSAVAGALYDKSLRDVTMAQNTALSTPFTRVSGHTPRPTSQCSVGPTSGIKVEIECQATIQTYIKLGQSSSDKHDILDSVTAITAALKAEGYQSGSNNVTLTSLVAGTYDGKDYSPDAFYRKVTGKDTCIYDTSVAYSNPAQPAINMSLNCSRTLDMFGKPAARTIYY